MGEGKLGIGIGEYALFCTNCDARCYGYAVGPGWEEQECVFCGGFMEGLRVLGAMNE